ncbi:MULTISPECIES: hypothetical protein [unclassified Lentimonas]|uniref:hypothetical protein n=1 Tax=unclassified Lentimonas TaxID=2630993 RepID=UPI001326FA9B|nr:MULTISPECIES: hypothetical protein [unclassified Lentimonas]CAA6689973.1 Unannotated [Lentimonas sp. CC10]CAA6691049.1 Unannotated [Lentimonas sp. CC19]CAA7069337.1 Unannotated [Lentimonas sp. CC11]
MMKISYKKVCGALALTAIFTGSFSSIATAVTKTQANVNYGQFTADATWVGGVAPVSGADSIVATTNMTYNGSFELGSGQTWTRTGGTYVFFDGGRDGIAAALTLKSGSSMNYAGRLNETTSHIGANDLILEAGSSISTSEFNVRIDIASNWTTTWVADATGVTNFNAATSRITGSSAIFDLSSYDLGANGSTIVFMTTAETGTFGSVSILGGYTADVDYSYNGNTQIALTNISAIPEPSACAMLAGLLALGSVMMRRRKA